MTDNVRVESLENGLTIVLEPMDDVQSAAFTILLPAGSAFDPADQNGTAAILSDFLMRGAGDRNTQQLSLALDNLGVQRSENVTPRHLTFSGATLGENLHPTLEIYRDVLRAPQFPDELFDAVRMGLEQSLTALEDDPRQKIMYELRRQSYPVPWGQPTIGRLDDLPNLSTSSAIQQYQQGCSPQHTVIGIAGHFDPDQTLAQLENLFADWPQRELPELEVSAATARTEHIQQDSAQTHIALAWPSVPYRDELYYAAWAAINVLSGGMSSRLWTEVREKRGLCYDVHASLHSLKDHARVLAYAGSVTDRAQETLDVMWQEFHRLADGIEVEELDRCKARAKSSLIMQQESTMARSSSIARDWYHLGRVTTLDEVRDRIEQLTVDSVLDYVRTHPPSDVNLLTIGPGQLDTSACQTPVAN